MQRTYCVLEPGIRAHKLDVCAGPHPRARCIAPAGGRKRHHARTVASHTCTAWCCFHSHRNRCHNIHSRNSNRTSGCSSCYHLTTSSNWCNREPRGVPSNSTYLTVPPLHAAALICLDNWLHPSLCSLSCTTGCSRPHICIMGYTWHPQRWQQHPISSCQRRHANLFHHGRQRQRTVTRCS